MKQVVAWSNTAKLTAQELTAETAARGFDVIALIKDSYSALSPAEQSVADAILSDVSAAVTAPIAEMSRRACVSEPTVTRFCRSVGCAGLRDLKLRLAQSLVVGELFLTDRAPAAQGGDAMPPFWNSIFTEARLALREAERQLDPAFVLQAGDCIASASHVLVIGLGGSSSALAEETQIRLFRYGVQVNACRDPYLARMMISTFRPDDVVIAISATGRTREVIDCVELARQYRCRTIAITTPGSELADAAEVGLTTLVAEYPDALTPSAARFAFLAIIDLVAAATGYCLGPKARENLRRIKFNLTDPRSSESLGPLGY